MNKQLPKLKGYDLTKEEYINANKEGKLLRLGIHVNTPKCNLGCPYCMNNEGNHYINNINKEAATTNEIKDWIYQAYELGAKYVVIDGEFEPLSNYKQTKEVLYYAACLGITPMLITNLTLLSEEIVKELNNINVSILGKLNVPMVNKSHDCYKIYSEIQNELVGIKTYNAYEVLKSKLEMLIKYGFNEISYNENGTPTTRLGIETVIIKQNFDFILPLFAQMRKMNIYIHAEPVKPQGIVGLGEFYIDTLERKKLFYDVARQDRELGFENEVINPVYASGNCLKHLGTLNIRYNGEVIPCPSVELYVGSLRKESMEKIFTNNQYINILRDLHSNIRGDCKNCELFLNNDCYGGCRGYTYMYLRQKGYTIEQALTASDPSCWRVENIL